MKSTTLCAIIADKFGQTGTVLKKVRGTGDFSHTFNPRQELPLLIRVYTPDGKMVRSKTVSFHLIEAHYDYLASETPFNGWTGKNIMKGDDISDGSCGAFIPVFEGKENVLEIKNSETSRYHASYKLDGPKVRGTFTGQCLSGIE